MPAATSAIDRAHHWSGMLEWFSSRKPRAVTGAFLDRDGIINEHIAGGYVLDRSDFRWLPGVVTALGRLAATGRTLFVVTNQSCINRGLLSADKLTSIMMEMIEELDQAGVPCAGWLCCPHRPDEGCLCRKPGSAMLRRAAAVTGVRLNQSVLIGDSPSDIEAAQRVGTRGFLVERNSPPALAAAIDHLVGETV